jgi:hypothetical protein
MVLTGTTGAKGWPPGTDGADGLKGSTGSINDRANGKTAYEIWMKEIQELKLNLLLH